MQHSVVETWVFVFNKSFKSSQGSWGGRGQLRATLELLQPVGLGEWGHNLGPVGLNVGWRGPTCGVRTVWGCLGTAQALAQYYPGDVVVLLTLVLKPGGVLCTPSLTLQVPLCLSSPLVAAGGLHVLHPQCPSWLLRASAGHPRGKRMHTGGKPSLNVPLPRSHKKRAQRNTGSGI